MFEDILGPDCKKPDGIDILTFPDKCPYCGSTEVGLTRIDNEHTCFFCADCGYVWECD